MTKILIPIITLTILTAGIFALMPVEQATAVHTTIQGTQMTLVDFNTSADIGATDIVCNSDAAFVVYIVASAPDTDGDTLTLIETGSSTITLTGDNFVSTNIGAPGLGGTGYSTVVALAEADELTIGGAGGGTNEIMVSLITTSGATANCA